MKNLKNTILRNVAALLMLAAVVSSCDSFLGEDPHSVKTDQWTSQVDAEVSVNQLYDSGLPALYSNRNNGWHPTRLMYGGLMSGLYVDDRKDGDFSANTEMLNITFQTVASEVNNLYRMPYEAINRANLIIERTPGLFEKQIITEVKKNELMGQAYFFRALSYFYLIKEFGCLDGQAKDNSNGGVPLVLETYSTADPTVIQKPRAPIADVYAAIESDLLEAIKVLENKNKTFYSNGSRITKPAAQALLAAVYLQWAGYPVQNTAKYVEAAKMAENVITGGSGHDLEASADTYLKSAFNIIKESKNNIETIYAVEYNEPLSKGNPYINACLTGAATNWLNDAGAKIFATAVLDNMYHVSTPVIKSYAAGDVRGMEKNFFFQNYESFETGTYNNWFWFDEDAMINSKGSSLDFPVLRMSEVYLIAAEALLKQSSPNPSKARGYVEEVRKRAFTVNGILSSNYSLPETITIEDVLTERLHEFPLEFKVWDDIRRTRLYPQLQADNTLKWVDIATAKPYNKKDGKTFSSNMHMLIWPIPQAALERNRELRQNPGYF